MDSKTRKETVRFIRSAWGALPYLSEQSFRDGRETLRTLAVSEEKQHRKCAPDGVTHPATTTDAALCIAVHDIAKHLANPEPCEWRYFLERRQSWILAAALVDINRKEIAAAWEGFDVKALLALDYADLCRDE